MQVVLMVMMKNFNIYYTKRKNEIFVKKNSKIVIYIFIFLKKYLLNSISTIVKMADNAYDFQAKQFSTCKHEKFQI